MLFPMQGQGVSSTCPPTYGALTRASLGAVLSVVAYLTSRPALQDSRLCFSHIPLPAHSLANLDNLNEAMPLQPQ